MTASVVVVVVVSSVVVVDVVVVVEVVVDVTATSVVLSASKITWVVCSRAVEFNKSCAIVLISDESIVDRSIPIVVKSSPNVVKSKLSVVCSSSCVVFWVSLRVVSALATVVKSRSDSVVSDCSVVKTRGSVVSNISDGRLGLGVVASSSKTDPVVRSNGPSVVCAESCVVSASSSIAAPVVS